MNGPEPLRPSPLPPPGRVTCDQCKRSLPLVAHAQTRYVACGPCKILYDLARPEGPEIIRRFLEASAPTIPLGRKGRLKGIVYQVIGYLHRRESGPDYRWNEYVLFNPLHGYAFLSQYNGHWNYLVPTHQHPDVPHHTRDFEFEGEAYALFAKYKAHTLYAEGEFHWDLLDDQANVEEFVAPPLMLIRERSPDGIEWFRGEYTEPKEVWTAFAPPGLPPEKIGVAPSQTLPGHVRESTLKWMTAAALVLLLGLQVWLSLTTREETVFKASYPLPDTSAIPPIVTPPFTVAGNRMGTSNLEFDLRAPVQNEWLDLEATLVNDHTGEEYAFEVGVEYYSGYEGGENWSEGSQSESRFLSAIPAGRYQLNHFQSKSPTSSNNHFQLEARQGVSMFSNFYLTLLAVLLYPAYQWWRINNFERRRWMNSDYGEE